MARSGGGGCCPSMDLMRSEAMQLVQVIIPAESAHLTVSYLGDLGLLQFKDVRLPTPQSCARLGCSRPPSSALVRDLAGDRTEHPCSCSRWLLDRALRSGISCDQQWLPVGITNSWNPQLQLAIVCSLANFYIGNLIITLRIDAIGSNRS